MVHATNEQPKFGSQVVALLLCQKLADLVCPAGRLDDELTTVEVVIEAVPDGHRVSLVQQGFPTMEARDDFAGAWPDVLDELARRVSLTGQT